MKKYKLEVVRNFTDVYTKEKYQIGKELNVEEERAFELFSSPYHLVKFISCEGNEDVKSVKKENDALKAEFEKIKTENDALKAELEKINTETNVLKTGNEESTIENDIEAKKTEDKKDKKNK